MMHFSVPFLTLALLGILISGAFTAGENDPEEYLKKANDELQSHLHILTNVQWDQASNITQENEDKVIAASKEYDIFRKKQYTEISAYDYGKLTPLLRRQFEKIALIGTSALDPADSLKLKEVEFAMENVYSTATVTANGKENLSLEPELTKILAESTNETLLREVWLNWRDATGPKMRRNFITYYKLGNKAAEMNKLPGKTFKTFDDLWMSSWETDDLKEKVDNLMEQTMPIYKKIHAYVRYHLAQKYPNMPTDGSIPAHLLGNMWAQQWSSLLNIIPSMNPHFDVDPADNKVNERLQTWTVEQMVQLSEKFFYDLGMDNMTSIFWKKSILTKPTNRNLTCHASAWDFYDGQDFRIKQCTEKNINDLVTVHHEMGHIQYYQNYAHQPAVYRDGANPGFHEAIGDLIALSVSSPEHLSKVGLLQREEDEVKQSKVNLNYQLKMALEKIVFLPFAYVMDKWRWDVFGNPQLEGQLNRHWWELRLKYQGLSPPGRKRSETDFDPGAKYHIPAGVEYVRYFASHVLQFQFFEHMCSYMDNVSVLYKCDFDGNKAAGSSLKRMLAKGSSDTWQNILQEFIGTRKMSLDSLNKYFQPLNEYLDSFIASHNITIGWDANVDDYIVNSTNPLVGNIPFAFLASFLIWALSRIRTGW